MSGDPFTIFIDDPKYVTVIDEIVTQLNKNKSSFSTLEKRIVTINGRLEKHRIDYKNLVKAIEHDLVLSLVCQKYHQHLRQREQEKLAVKNKMQRLARQQQEIQEEMKNIELTTKPTGRRTGASVPDLPVSSVPVSHPVQIFLKDLSGKTCTYTTVLSADVGKMLNELHTVADVAEDMELRVLWSGKQLEAGKSFHDYGIEDHACLEVVGRLRGGGKTKRTTGTKKGRLNLAQALFEANEAQLETLFKKYDIDLPRRMVKDDEESLGNESEVSGASEEYAYSSRGYDDGCGFVVDDDDDDDDSEYVPISGEGDDGYDDVVDMVREIEAREDFWMLSPSHVQLLCRDAGLYFDQVKQVISCIVFPDPVLIKCIHCSRSLKEYRTLTCMDCNVSKGGCSFKKP